MAFHSKDKVWLALKSYIIRQSRATLSPVFCSGSSSDGKGRMFSCYSLNDANSKSKLGKRVEEEYRKTILVNDGERGSASMEEVVLEEDLPRIYRMENAALSLQ